MRRGDIYLIGFEPVQGSEADKARPAVLVPNDAANRSVERNGRGVLTVVPVQLMRELDGALRRHLAL